MRASALMIEQLISILVFAVTAAICVQIFVTAALTSAAGSDLNYSLALAQNSAEAYKSSGGDLDATGELLGVTEQDGTLTLYYDASWQSCTATSAVYCQTVSSTAALMGLSRGSIILEKLGAAEPIYTLSVTAREGGK